MTRIQNVSLLIARILMCVLFLEGGWGKLVNAGAIQTAFDQRYHLPLPVLAWLIAWIIELFGGLAVLFGIYARAAGLVLAIWCIATALVGHTNFADRNQEIHFWKNMAMCGGFLYMFCFGAGIYSIDRLRTRYR
ncbi:MAG TPA: DoxX family protein [Stellaceae bacterium]|jgi:putative oxidoreductase|nr:DoxX family protein [Stellaceae bacterium]